MVEKVAKLVGRVAAQTLPRSLVRVGSGHSDETAAPSAAPCLHQSCAPEFNECLPEGDRGHAKLGGKLRFGRELLAIGQHAELDRLDKPAFDGSRPAITFQRREDAARDVEWDMAWHRRRSLTGVWAPNVIDIKKLISYVFCVVNRLRGVQ